MSLLSTVIQPYYYLVMISLVFGLFCSILSWLMGGTAFYIEGIGVFAGGVEVCDQQVFYIRQCSDYLNYIKTLQKDPLKV